MKNKLILATNNSGKIDELNALLNPIHCIPQAQLNIEDVEETGLSFVENAFIKARNASLLGNGPALADDSGLVVEALNGEPGIYSARFAQRNQQLDNLDYLLHRMQDVPVAERKAYFYCALVLLRHAGDPAPFIVTAKWEGVISLERAGSEGFGYDPLFYLPEYQCTAAQLSLEKKNAVSHRAIAIKALRSSLLKESFYV